MDNDFFFKILNNAIEEGIGIAINKVKREDDFFHFLSRFFYYDEEKEEIIIDIPSSSDDIGLLMLDDKIEIFFISKCFRLGFFSTITGFSEFELSSGEFVPAMRISKPDGGLDLQRRRDFRVQTPPMAIEACYQIENEDEEQGTVSIECVSYDISRSGIAVSNSKDAQNKLKLEKNNYVSIKIKIDDNIISMEGIVQSKRELYDGKKTVFGIDFVEDKPDKMQYKRNLSIIMKYVMKRQREIMLKF